MRSGFVASEASNGATMEARRPSPRLKTSSSTTRRRNLSPCGVADKLADWRQAARKPSNHAGVDSLPFRQHVQRGSWSSGHPAKLWVDAGRGTRRLVRQPRPAWASRTTSRLAPSAHHLRCNRARGDCRRSQRDAQSLCAVWGGRAFRKPMGALLGSIESGAPLGLQPTLGQSVPNDQLKAV